jgi:hypothetical protein
MHCIAAVCVALWFCAIAPLAQSQSSADFFKDTFERMLRNDPEYATGVGRHEYDDRWTDWSKIARDERRRFFEQRLAQLNSAQVGDGAQDLLTKRVVRYDFESRLEAWELNTHLLRVGQLYGLHNLVYTVIGNEDSCCFSDLSPVKGSRGRRPFNEWAPLKDSQLS